MMSRIPIVGIALLIGAAAADPAAAQPAAEPEPPPGALLEGDQNLPPPRTSEEVPQLTPESASGEIKPLPPELPDRTKDLLGDTTTILDIPIEQIPNYRDRMRTTIEDLSEYARNRSPGFTLVTFGGFELLRWSQREYDLAELKGPKRAATVTDTTPPVGYFMRQYMQSIDGYILDGFFCAPLRVPAADVAAMRDEALKGMSVDHCPPNLVADAFRSASASNIVAHVDADLDLEPERQFGRVPDARPVPENPKSVERLGDARNMLINLNSRPYETKDAWLAALGDTNHDVLVITGFFNGDKALTAEEIRRLKYKKLGSRRLVLAWLDTGFASDDQYYWKRGWGVGNPTWITSFDRAVPGRYQVEFWNPAWKAIVGQTFAGLMDLGFDGIVIAGVDSYLRWESMTPVN